MSYSSCLRFLFIILAAFIFSSCKPAIRSFHVSPPVITGDQKVHIDLDVKGVPSLEFNEHFSPDSSQLLEFTLISTKAGKEKRKTVQVLKMKPQASINITFSTNKIEGDMVVASGENNNNQWSNFQIVSLSTPMSRELVVMHGGRTVTLKADGSFSPDLAGTTAGGEWSFKTILTAAEKADSTKIPEELKIQAVIKPLNP